MAPDQSDVTIRVAPLAKASGQLVDRTNKPVMLGFIRYGIHIPESDEGSLSMIFSGGEAILDSEGGFTLTGLVPGAHYEVGYVPRGNHLSGTNLRVFSPSSSATFDLRKVVFVPDRRRDEPPVRVEVDNVPLAMQRHQRLTNLLVQSLQGSEFDLVVQRTAGSNESTNTLPKNWREASYRLTE